MAFTEHAGAQQRELARAEKLTAEGDHESALPIWEWLTSSQRCDVGNGMWGRLAACYRRLSREDDLEELLVNLRRAGRPHVQVVLQMALARVDSGRFEDALAVLDAAKPAYEADRQAEILRIRTTILSHSGRHREAMACAASIPELGTSEAGRQGAFALALAELKQRRETIERSDQDTKLRAYWQDRRQFVYIHVCHQLIKLLGASARVVADIGSNRTPILDFFPGSPLKYSVDPASPFSGTGVVAINADFLTWNPPERIHVGTCLQVLEHIPDVNAFASRLLELCEIVLISVPYMERPGVNSGHIHSEIDLEKVARWFGRAPNFHYVAQELSGDERIICVFDRTTTVQWPTLCEKCRHGLPFRYRWSPAPLKGNQLEADAIIRADQLQ